MNEEKFVDYYALLGVESTASAKDIKRAYRKKALRLHPDKNPDNPDAATLFDAVTKASELLSDEQERAKYDAKLRVREARKVKRAKEDAQVKGMREALEKREAAAMDAYVTRQRQGQAASARARNMDFIARMQQNGLFGKQVDSEPPRARKRSRPEHSSAGRESYGVLLRWKKKKKHVEAVEAMDTGEDPPEASFTAAFLKLYFQECGLVEDITVDAEKRMGLIEFADHAAVEKALKMPSPEPSFKLKITRRGKKKKDSAASTESRTAGAATGGLAGRERDMFARTKTQPNPNANASAVPPPAAPSGSLAEREQELFARMMAMASRSKG